MLGDFLPNTTNPNGAGAAVKSRPQPRPNDGGYGSSSFGDMKKPAQQQPLSVQQHRPVQPRPMTQPKPQAARPQAQAVTIAAPVAQATAPAAAVHARPVLLPIGKKRRGGKVPLILTIVGVVIFVGGVVALFVYALTPQ